MNVHQLAEDFKDLWARKQSGDALHEFPNTREKISAARIKDLGTHLGYFTESLRRASSREVDAGELTDANIQALSDFLVSKGKNPGVIQNTVSTIRVFQKFAIECGVKLAIVPRLERAKKHQIYERSPAGKPVFLAVKKTDRPTDRYAFHQRDWTPRLNEECERIQTYFTDPLAEHRNQKMLRKTTMDQRITTFARFFGVLIIQGVPKDDLTFEMCTSVNYFKSYRNFHFKRRGFDGEFLRSELELLRHLTLGFFQNAKRSEEMASIIKRCDFQLVRDVDALIRDNHPEHLWQVGVALIAEAQDYERNLKRKKGRKDPQAMMAAKWHRAALFCLVLCNWLREHNVVHATQKNIFRDNSGWHLSFTGQEMKNGKPFADDVIDFWDGERLQPLIDLALDKAAETRPLLVAKYLRKNPGSPEPSEFFLNENGKRFSEGGVRILFDSETARYLGQDRRINPHAVRAVNPSWLLVREGPHMLPVIQHRLHHKSIAVTEQHYARVKRIFNSRLAKLQMEEKAKQAKIAAKLDRLPDQINGKLDAFLAEIRERYAAPVDPQTLGAIVEAAIRKILVDSPQE